MWEISFDYSLVLLIIRFSWRRKKLVELGEREGHDVAFDKGARCLVSEENKDVEEEAREGSINIKDSIKYFLA